MFIIANWKMNPTTQAEAKRLFDSIEKGIKKIKDLKNIEIVICPPFVWLPVINVSASSGPAVGGQNCNWEEQGAYTGEISPKMIKSAGCKFVIIGHSERRNYFNETNDMINKKLLAAFKSGLKPILCVGEKEGEDMGLMVGEQLSKGLKDINRAKIRNLIIAYEPVWAIGAGKPCLLDDALRANLLIRQSLTKLYNRKLAEETPILYGGSVNSEIAEDYIKEAGMNGLLIGGASLDAGEFVKIIKQVFNSQRS